MENISIIIARSPGLHETYSWNIQSERSDKMMSLHKSPTWPFPDTSLGLLLFSYSEFLICWDHDPWIRRTAFSYPLCFLFFEITTAEVFCFIAYILLQVKFEAQKKILQRLESYLQMLNGVSVTTAAPRSEGLCCCLHPIIPSVSSHFPILLSTKSPE